MKQKMIRVHAPYTPVDPDVEYVVHDANEVVVAIVAHKEDADLLARVKGYGWFTDTSPHRGTHRVGEDAYRALGPKDRAELKMPPRNPHAVV